MLTLEMHQVKSLKSVTAQEFAQTPDPLVLIELSTQYHLVLSQTLKHKPQYLPQLVEPYSQFTQVVLVVQVSLATLLV